MNVPFIWRLYRPFMRLAHRYNWHHATVCHPDGDTLFWCQWCGMRDLIEKADLKSVFDFEPAQDPE